MADFSPLIRYWSRYVPIGPPEQDWLDQHALVLDIPSKTSLFDTRFDQTPAFVYFVCEGLLATAWWDESGHRHIARILPPTHSASTRLNLYSSQAVPHGLVALRHSRCIQLPITALRDYKDKHQVGSTLTHVLQYQSTKQYLHKERLLSIPHPIQRYIAFYHDPFMRTFLDPCTQREQADYLGISRMSITRARHIIARLRQ